MRLNAKEAESDSHNGFQYEEFDAGQYKLYKGYKWIGFNLNGIPDGATEVKLEAKMNTPNGSLGIFIPSSDLVVHGITVKESFEYRNKNIKQKLYVECESWKFGKDASVTISTGGKGEFDSPISFSILARPVSDNLSNFDVTVTITPDIVGSRISENFKFDRADEIKEHHKVELMKSEYDRFAEYDGVMLQGDGNIVHPKQYFTIRGLQYVFDEYLDHGNSAVKIGYIGTDTTENLRSILRWIQSSKKLERITEMVVFHTTEWDKKFLKYSKLEEQIKLEYPRINLAFKELSNETVRKQKSKRKCDIIISTYVTPYIDNNGKDNFISLLKNCMHSDSYLISVDPQTGPDSVRSLLNNQSINNDEIYKHPKLNYVTAKSPVTEENQSVEWAIWRPGLPEV